MKEGIGERFGKLKVIKESGSDKNGNRRVLCTCDCGKEKIILFKSLKNRSTKSCGCLRRDITAELASNRFTTHGKIDTPEYNSWCAMLSRCNNLNHISYSNYGGRGIIVCERWLGSFENFFEDMGEKPEPKQLFSIERVNNDGNYCPENCRWASKEEQCNNTRVNRCLTFRDKTFTITEWARKLNIPYEALRSRIRLGWDTEKALTFPVKSKK